eukprot:2370312-Prymnesium_polylepis.1
MATDSVRSTLLQESPQGAVHVKVPKGGCVWLYSTKAIASPQDSSSRLLHTADPKWEQDGSEIRRTQFSRLETKSREL